MTGHIRLMAGSALLLIAASCAVVPKSAPPPPAPRPPIPVTFPPPPPQPALPPVSAWEDLPIIEGDWSFDSAKRIARFVDASGQERASLECLASQRALRLRSVDDTAARVDVLTSAATNSHDLRFGDAMIPIADITLDRIAFSRGRFGLRGSSLLVLPVQAEIGRVIEDCRG
ncbi:MAG: hypothetical protein HC788_14065 [Sphingopyxis sp.]|nr:hypothetical protein [Sphingopyxis sp.]